MLDLTSQLRDLVKTHGSDRVLDALACAFDDMSGQDSIPKTAVKCYHTLGKRINAVKVPATITKHETIKGTR